MGLFVQVQVWLNDTQKGHTLGDFEHCSFFSRLRSPGYAVVALQPGSRMIRRIAPDFAARTSHRPAARAAAIFGVQAAVSGVVKVIACRPLYLARGVLKRPGRRLPH